MPACQTTSKYVISSYIVNKSLEEVPVEVGFVTVIGK